MPTNKGSTNSATKTKVQSILLFQKIAQRLTLGQTANLERIRNNQRRCRARQKEYIAELEDKIRQYESGGSTSSTDPKLQHFIRENESLKRILQSLGLGKEFLKAYGKAAQIAPDISRAQLGSDIPSQTKECSSSAPSVDILQPNLTPTITREPQTEQEPALSTMDVEAQFEDDYQLFEGLIQVDTVPSWEPFGFLNTSTSALESLQADDQTESLIQMIGDTMRTESFGNTTTAEDISDTTTLCSSAFSLVLKNNLKGYSAADLDLKLRMGYRCGATPSEGCRVDNKILISVLAEISL